MKYKKNFFIFILLLFSKYYLIKSYFDKSSYIKLFNNMEEFTDTIKKIEHGFLLIYSKYCVHCKRFAPNYIKLSELFHNEIFFYAMSSSSKYLRIFKIFGFPTILFYTKQNYKEYDSSRSVKALSKYIRKYISYNCTEITYNNIDIAYNDVYQNEDRNFVIGYFNNNSKYINSFISITNNVKNNYIDLCYYCTDFNLIKNDKDNKFKTLSLFKDIKENEIRTYSRNKGNYSFIFNETDDENNNENNYEHFLFNNVINIYEEVNDNDRISYDYLERIKNKKFILFVYDNKNGNDIKQKYINIIYDLYNLTNNKNDSLFIYILLNKSRYNRNFKNFEINKIYLCSNISENGAIIEDINIIKNEILKNNHKEISTDILTNSKNIDLTDNIKKETLINNISLLSTISNKIDFNNISFNNFIKINNNSYIINNTKFDKNNKNYKIINNIYNLNNISNNNIFNSIKINNIIHQNKSEQKDVKIINEINIKNIIDITRNNISSNIDYILKNKSKQNFIRKTKIKNNNTFNQGYNEINIEENNKNENDYFNKKKIIYILLIILIIFTIIYFIITKYLCVGFIKVYDTQVIEFSQPNKIEIV